MPLIYKNFLVTRLEEAITATSTHAKIPSADYNQWVAGMSAGDFFFAVLIDATNTREVVQVNFTGSSPALGVAIDRGKEGTVARGWAAGTFFWQDLTQGSLEVQQKAGFRQGAFNPNGVLAGDYFGEKFYQSDLQLWWKFVSGSEWRLIVGEIITVTPTFNPAAGTYFNGTLVEILSATPGADIYYTTDGSDPDDTDTLYTVPFSLPDDVTTTLKAIAFGPERWFTPSAIASGAFTMQDEGSMWVVAATLLSENLYSMVEWNGELWIAGTLGRTYKFNKSAGTIDLQNNFTGFPSKDLFVGNSNQLQAIMRSPNVRGLSYAGGGSEWFDGGFETGTTTISRDFPAVEWSANPGNAYFTANTNLRYWDYTLGGYTVGPLIAAATQANAILIVDNDGSGFDRIYIGCSDGNVRRLNVAQTGWDLTTKPGAISNVQDMRYDSVNNRLFIVGNDGRLHWYIGAWSSSGLYAARINAENVIVRNNKAYFNHNGFGDMVRVDPAGGGGTTPVLVAPSIGYNIDQLINFDGTIYALTQNRLLRWA